MSPRRAVEEDVDISEFEAPQQRQALRVDLVLKELDEENEELARKLRKALAAPHVGDSRIAQIVTGWGHNLSQGAVHTWRARNGQ